MLRNLLRKNSFFQTRSLFVLVLACSCHLTPQLYVSYNLWLQAEEGGIRPPFLGFGIRQHARAHSHAQRAASYPRVVRFPSALNELIGTSRAFCSGAICTVTGLCVEHVAACCHSYGFSVSFRLPWPSTIATSSTTVLNYVVFVSAYWLGILLQAVLIGLWEFVISWHWQSRMTCSSSMACKKYAVTLLPPSTS